METPQFLNKNNSGGPTHPLEWFFRISLLGALGYGGLRLFNFLAPQINFALWQFWQIALAGIPLIAIVLFVIKNPMFLSMAFKTLCRKLTSFFIKMDPLSFMDRYVDLLKDKLVVLKKTKEVVSAKKIAMERKIKDLNADGRHKMDLAVAAKKMGNESEAANQSSMAMQDKQSIDIFLPILKRLTDGLAFLDKLAENWGRAIEQLTFTVQRKRDEYETLREMAKAMNQAEEFASGDTEAARIYNESVKSLEEKVTQKMSYIDEFEKNTKGIMDTMGLEKLASDQEGLRALEENQNLFMDDNLFDFKQVPLDMVKGDDGVYAANQAQVSASGVNNKYMNTLK